MRPRLPALLDPPVTFGLVDPATDPASVVDDRDEGSEGDERSGLDRLATAIDQGAGGVATDVWLTADGIPVLSRVGRIGRRLRRRPLAQVAVTELPPSAVPLRDLLVHLDGMAQVSLEVQDPAAFEPILATVRDADPAAEERLWLCHPDVSTLTGWRPRTSARLINTASYRALDGGLERRAAELEQRNLDGLRLAHGEWTGGRVTLLHRFARLALGIGPIHEREAAALIDTGIDGVYSERVVSMMAVMAQFYEAG